MQRTTAILSVSALAAIVALGQGRRTDANGSASSATAVAVEWLAPRPPSNNEAPVISFAQDLPASVRADLKNRGGIEFSAGTVEELSGVIKVVMGRCLPRYTHRLIEENLSKVYVVRDLTVYGVRALGTFEPDTRTILICYRQQERDAKATNVHRLTELVFHHEFLELMLARHRPKFAESEWRNALPSGFEYDPSHGERDPDRMTCDAEQLREGFVAPYSRSQLPDDVSMLAMNMFVRPSRVWEWSKESLPLAKKVDILQEFYFKLDPRMDRVFFAGMKDSPE